MAFNFEFAFFAPRHSYVASVTQVAGLGYLIDPSDTACFRVPASFTKGYRISAQTRYISDIRGHDFISHTGRWATADSHGISKKSENIINEITALRDLGQELERRGYNKADYKLTLGPRPGSFFADVKKLGLYRWERFPRDLNNAIQDELAERKYGKISDVAMNAGEGWVMHFREEAAMGGWFKGRKRAFQFCWGGEAALPETLVTALQRGRERGAKIRHIFLNHQNLDEYLLLFSDGYAHANLHYEFNGEIERLVHKWVRKTSNKELNWNFTYSCQCLESQQKQVDAAYYNRRGRFHLLRSLNNPELSCLNIDLALDYFGEAITQDPKSRKIRHSQRLALVAARRKKRDHKLESHIDEARLWGDPQTSRIDARDSSAAGVFRNLYLQLINSEEDYQNLERQLYQLNLSLPEWSYSLASSDERFSPFDIELIGDDDQSSAVVVLEPVEMLGSIPPSQRRHSDLVNEQVTTNQESTSAYSHGQNNTIQRQLSELSSEGNSPAQRRPSAVSIERIMTSRLRAIELSSDQIPASQRRPSMATPEQIAGPRRASEFRNAQNATTQQRILEAASDETTITVQSRLGPSESQSFVIYTD